MCPLKTQRTQTNDQIQENHKSQPVTQTSFFGYGGIDYLKGGDGNDTLNGGASSDFAIYDGNLADYTITRTSTTDVTIANGRFTDTLSSVEHFQFDDVTANIWQYSVV